MFEEFLLVSLGLGHVKIDGAIHEHRGKRFVKFRKEANKHRTTPYCLFGNYNKIEGKYGYVFTDLNGDVKYYSNRVDYRTHFFLYNASDKKIIGVVKIRVSHLKFWKPHFKGFQIFGSYSGKIDKETIEFNRKQCLIVGGGKQTTIIEKDGTIIARITNSMDLYMVEYTDVKYELIALIYCLSEHVFYDVPPSGGA